MVFDLNIWRAISAVLLAMALVLPASLAAQETPSAPNAEQHYIVLKGGGELVGVPIKETPRELFVDVGPRILGLPVEAIISSKPLSEALEESKAIPDAPETGLYDPETGSVIFRSRAETEDFLSQTEMVERAKRSVVLISNPRGAGSGFILDEEGRIVTNHHVINREKYHTVNVFEKRGENWERKTFRNVPVVAYSSLYDIAVLQLDMDEVEEEGVELVSMPIAPPGSLEVGDSVYAIGNPGGAGQLLEHSVTEGIVSSLARNIQDVLYIQTTAAVNPGNSGGPLINQNGEVVGLVTLKAFFQEGIAFALPVDLIRHFLRHTEAYEFSESAQNRGFRYLSPE